MITKILKKDYDKVQEMRGHSKQAHSLGYLVFRGNDGKYYKCDKTGMAGVKEWTEYAKNLTPENTSLF
jgi:hypothetical protein